MENYAYVTEKSSFVEFFLEKPSIDFSQVKDVIVRAGQDIKIAVPIKGWPVPTTTWEQGDLRLSKDNRTKIEATNFE